MENFQFTLHKIIILTEHNTWVDSDKSIIIILDPKKTKANRANLAMTFGSAKKKNSAETLPVCVFLKTSFGIDDEFSIAQLVLNNNYCTIINNHWLRGLFHVLTLTTN